MKKNKEVSKENKIVDAFKVLSIELGKHPSDVTYTELLKSGLVTDHEIKMMGGVTKIKKAHFPVDGKDLGTITKLSDTSSYINKLEKQLGKKDFTKDEMIKAFNKLIAPVKMPKVNLTLKKSGIKRQVVAMLNDTHYGLIVPTNEVGGVNSFSWKEACRRTAYLAQQVVEYKKDKRNEVEMLHIVLNGDLLAGQIHDLTARTLELLGNQQNGAIHILTYFISHCAQHYKYITVHGLSGNHEDSPHRREGGHRVTSHKHDSAVAPVYFALSSAFRDQKNITFKIPEGMFADIQLPAGRCFVTHGDTMFTKQLGNPGRSLNTDSLGSAINKYNYGEISQGKEPFKLCLFGHVHTEAQFTTWDGTKVAIAPSLSGIDIYAKSLAINNNQVGQLIFESTKQYIYSDARLVDLISADNDARLDKIIPIYKNELQWKKRSK